MLNNFKGGLNNALAPHLVNPTGSVASYNVDIVDGSIKWAEVVGTESYATNSGPFVYISKLGTSSEKVLSSGDSYVEKGDSVFFSRTSGVPQEATWNGSAVVNTDLGVAGPTAAPTATVSLVDIKKRKPAQANNKKTHKQNAAISYYRVRSGDSLWSIARKFQVSARDIRQWNGLRNNMIHPGKKLKIVNG